ncbi:MAG: hypothetical protein IT515_07615 [Burkholderiales bacterium]|nr:hypothetical protein [Burkholderiales bacterium]
MIRRIYILDQAAEEAVEADVVVIEHNDERIVVAFAHHSRQPGYWPARLRT